MPWTIPAATPGSLSSLAPAPLPMTNQRHGTGADVVPGGPLLRPSFCSAVPLPCKLRLNGTQHGLWRAPGLAQLRSERGGPFMSHWGPFSSAEDRDCSIRNLALPPPHNIAPFPLQLPQAGTCLAPALREKMKEPVRMERGRRGVLSIVLLPGCPASRACGLLRSFPAPLPTSAFCAEGFPLIILPSLRGLIQ